MNDTATVYFLVFSYTVVYGRLILCFVFVIFCSCITNNIFSFPSLTSSETDYFVINWVRPVKLILTYNFFGPTPIHKYTELTIFTYSTGGGQTIIGTYTLFPPVGQIIHYQTVKHNEKQKTLFLYF